MQEVLIDYADPLMRVEKALKKAHDYLLDRDYVLALDQVDLAIVEARRVRVSVIHVMEKEDALRQQTPPV
jgi:type I site-specific restriction endonuclease